MRIEWFSNKFGFLMMEDIEVYLKIYRVKLFEVEFVKFILDSIFLEV